MREKFGGNFYNLYLRIVEKIAKNRTANISCHKVTAYALLDFTKCIRNNFKLKVLLFSASTDSHEILLIKFSRERNIENEKKTGEKIITDQSTGFKIV